MCVCFQTELDTECKKAEWKEKNNDGRHVIYLPLSSSPHTEILNVSLPLAVRQSEQHKDDDVTNDPAALILINEHTHTHTHTHTRSHAVCMWWMLIFHPQFLKAKTKLLFVGNRVCICYLLIICWRDYAAWCSLHWERRLNLNLSVKQKMQVFSFLLSFAITED